MLVAFLYLCCECMCSVFHMVPWIGLSSVIVVVPGQKR